LGAAHLGGRYQLHSLGNLPDVFDAFDAPFDVLEGLHVLCSSIKCKNQSQKLFAEL